MWQDIRFAVRMLAKAPMAMEVAVERQIWAVDRDAPITNVKTMDQILSDKVAGAAIPDVAA